MTSFASIADQIGRALLHSVWEGAAVAIVFAIALLALRKRSAQARYVVACVALLGMLLAPIATIALRPTPQPVHRDIVATVSVEPMPVAQSLPHDMSMPAVASPRHPALSMLQYATIVWAGGLLVVSLWQIAGWLTVRKFVRSAQPADDAAADRLKRLCDRMRFRFSVALRICDHLTTPALVGWLRPVILVAPAALCDLPVDYLESLLLHELAHVRRHDYLVNLLQTIAETLLFYHPAAWWVSRVIRDERENCCDDEVVRQTDAKTYVRALAFMESQRADIVGNLALTATGGRLLHRIERLTGHSRNRRPAAGTGATLVLLCGVIVVTACYAAKTPESPHTKPDSHSTTKINGPTRAVRPEDLVFAATSEYRIQPGDRLTVRIADLMAPNSVDTRTCVVSASGEIRLAVIADELKVAGLTDAEAEKAVIESYRAHQLVERANVNVVIAERQRQVFTVVGAVAHAGQFNLTDSRLRILNAIAIAGGIAGNDATRIVVLREADDHGLGTAIEIPADRLMAGDTSVNIAIRAMDTVVVSHAEEPAALSVAEMPSATQPAIVYASTTPVLPGNRGELIEPLPGFTGPVVPGMLVYYGLYLDGRGAHGPQFSSNLVAPVSKSGDIRLNLLMDKPIHVDGLTYDALKRAMNKAYSDAGYDAGAVQWVKVSPPVLPMQLGPGRVDADHPPRHLLDEINRWGGIKALKVREIRLGNLRTDSNYRLLVFGSGGTEISVEKLLAGDSESNILLEPDDIVVLR